MFDAPMQTSMAGRTLFVDITGKHGLGVSFQRFSRFRLRDICAALCDAMESTNTKREHSSGAGRLRVEWAAQGDALKANINCSNIFFLFNFQFLPATWLPPRALCIRPARVVQDYEIWSEDNEIYFLLFLLPLRLALFASPFVLALPLALPAKSTYHCAPWNPIIFS